LKRAEAHVRAGKIRGGELERWMKRQIEQAPLARVDYVAAVDPSSLQKTLTIPVLLAAAVFFGKTRLIDNRLVQ
jgi:pantoate--beta-alanine ligase